MLTIAFGKSPVNCGGGALNLLNFLNLLEESSYRKFKEIPKEAPKKSQKTLLISKEGFGFLGLRMNDADRKSLAAPMPRIKCKIGKPSGGALRGGMTRQGLFLEKGFKQAGFGSVWRVAERKM